MNFSMGSDAVTDASVFVTSPSGISPATQIKRDKYRYRHLRSRVYDAAVVVQAEIGQCGAVAQTDQV